MSDSSLVLDRVNKRFCFVFMSSPSSHYQSTRINSYHVSSMMSYTSYECEWPLSKHWHHPNPKTLLLSTSWIKDLPLKSAGSELSQSLEIASKPLLLLQFRVIHKVFQRGTKTVGFDLPLREHSIKSSVLRCVTEPVEKVGWDFFGTSSISQRLLHCATLGN